MKRFGFLDRAISELNKAGMECTVIDNVEPNPSVETVWRAKAMLAFEPDWIVAIGGGSALDAAKVMVFLRTSASDV
jgi:alcohol dehydrogenase class IV